MQTRSFIATALAASAFISLSHLALAAAPAGRLGNPHPGMTKAATRMNLTERQKAQIKPILQAASAKARALQQNPSLSPQQKQTQFIKIMQDTQNHIRPFLTPVQQKQMVSMATRQKQQIIARRQFQVKKGQ